MSEKTYDAIIIGGGHNGITLATYLQRAGMNVAIFERRHEEGGPVFTSECTAPGFLHNLHAQYMAWIEWMPFYQDFGLDRLGCRYVYPEAQSGIAFSDGRPPIVLYNTENLERTHRSIAVYSKQDADTFVEMRQKAAKAKVSIAQWWYSPPVLPSEGGSDPVKEMGAGLLQILGLPPHLAAKSGKEIIDYLFESSEFKALLYRQMQEFGPHLLMKNMGALAMISLFWMILNWRLAVGGTHSVAHAMIMAGIREGVHFYESSEVKKILINNGRATGVRLADGTEVKATKLVASNADLRQTFFGMVGEENLSTIWKERIRNFKVGTTCVLASTAMALHKAPEFKSGRHNPDINKTFYTVVGFDEPQQVVEYCDESQKGKIPKIPGAGIWVNSLWDPTYAPPGKHSLTGWFFFPKASSYSRPEWEEVQATYNDRFIDHFQKWAPNMTRENIIADYFYTPLDQQDEMRLVEGDFNNGGMDSDQLGHNRPFREAANYRTEIKDLYLCGPFMHPAGGVHCGPGYNAFKVIAEDFGLDRFWENKERGY